MLIHRLRFRLLVAAASSCALSALGAQDSAQRPTAGHAVRAPISIGNYPNVAGLRLNFRDRDLETVRGINATIWNPHEPATGRVRGFALGVPMTGAGDIEGAALGVFGVGATRSIRGIAIGGVGVGSGTLVHGIAVGGVGVGSGGDIEGIAMGLVGAGAGGNVRGALIGGVGAGVGGNLTGVAVGGVGVGAGGNVNGLLVGLVASGAGGNLRGIAVSGVATGAGGNMTGVAVSGIATGAGGTFHGLGAAVVAVGAPRLEGGFAAAVVGAKDAHAVVLAPAMFRIESGGSFRGASVSSFNRIKGAQHGLTIGLLNYARSLSGAQIGLLNIVADQRSHRVLPIVNWGRGS